MERQILPPGQDIESYVETLVPKTKADIIKLDRFATLLQKARRGFDQSFGREIDEKAGYPVHRIDYYLNPGDISYFTIDDYPLTHPEILSFLEQEGSPLDAILEYYLSNRPSDKPITSIIRRIQRPIVPQDYEALPGILRNNYRNVAQVLLEKARRGAKKGWPPNMLTKVIDLAKLSGQSIPDEQITTIQKTYHRINMERQLKTAQSMIKSGCLPTALMEPLESAVVSAKYLEEDTSFAKDASQRAVEETIESTRQELKRANVFTLKNFWRKVFRQLSKKLPDGLRLQMLM